MGFSVTKVFRIFLFAIAIAIVAAVVYVSIAPFGSRVDVRIDAGLNDSRVTFVNPFTTSTRIGPGKDGAIVEVPELEMGNPEVSFSVKVPYEDFKRATVEIKYSKVPDELIFGVGTGETARNVPIHNNALNNLGWFTMSTGGITLFQREKEYGSIDEFLRALPEISKENSSTGEESRVASYYFEPTQPLPPDVVLEKAHKAVRFPNTLRGQHEFYICLSEGKGNITFQKQDLNNYEGEDPLVVRLYQGNKLLKEESYPDDGDISASNKYYSPRFCVYRISDFSPGIYRVSFECDNDVLIKNFTSSERYICIADRVFLADNYVYRAVKTKPATIFTNAEVLTGQVWNPEAEQVVTVDNDGFLDLSEPFVEKYLEFGSGEKTVRVKKGAVMLSSPGGQFSFEAESLFDPFPIKTLNFGGNLDPNSYDYVISQYSIPKRLGKGSYLQKIRIDISDMKPQDKTYSFRLIAPGVSEINRARIDYLKLSLEK
ncbi:MAG: hypothetical protein PHP64_06335 [Actinomycetota bacterium]|nr:hypothetical protein [Actinomycetota bacterium]